MVLKMELALLELDQKLEQDQLGQQPEQQAVAMELDMPL